MFTRPPTRRIGFARICVHRESVGSKEANKVRVIIERLFYEGKKVRVGLPLIQCFNPCNPSIRVLRDSDPSRFESCRAHSGLVVMGHLSTQGLRCALHPGLPCDAPLGLNAFVPVSFQLASAKNARQNLHQEHPD